MSARRVSILTHREQAAWLSSERTRSRSAELERKDACGGQPAAHDLATTTSDRSINSPKRPRTLAPMQHPGLWVQRQMQGAEEAREHSELSDVLHSFASAGALRHGRTVDDELSRLKVELSQQGDRDRVSAARPLPRGTRVVLTGLANGSSYNGREAVVLGVDGRDRVMVHVCGASELCQLSVRVDNMAVLEEPATDMSYEAGRDFSEIHKLATLHAQQNAKREVERLAAEAKERRRAMENAVRADSLTSTSQRGVRGELTTRQRCRHGSKCCKPDCMDLHPWEADWVEGGAASGCDSKSQFKAAKGIYNLLAPVPRVRGRVPQKTKPPQGGSPSAQQNPKSTADIAVEIDRLLAQAGVPVAARQAAHNQVIPLLCSHGPAQPPQPRARNRLDYRGFRATMAGHPGHAQEAIFAPAYQGRMKASAETIQPKSLQELRWMQQSLQRSLDGVEQQEQAAESIGLHGQHSHELPRSAPRSMVAVTQAVLAEDDELQSPNRVPTWRDTEDPQSRRARIAQLVEIKKAEWRKQKLVRENAFLQEALVACGAAFLRPLPADGFEKDEGTSPHKRGKETATYRQRIRVTFEADE